MNAEAEERRFRQAIIDSQDAVWAVARHIHSLGGREVRIAPLAVRPSFNERQHYGDSGDILVRRLGQEELVRVEAKGRTLNFTESSDFPYPTIYIERINRLQKLDPASAYFVVNQALTHAAIIDGGTRSQWVGPTTFFDRTRGHEANCYEVPLALVRFVRLRGR